MSDVTDPKSSPATPEGSPPPVVATLPLAHSHGHSHRRKVKLLGRVGEEEACSLLTDRNDIVVGSALDCDLILSDPLVPGRAFILKHVKEHGDVHETCGTCWQIEAYPGARIFVNRQVARRELIFFGDTISVGCHLLFFLEGDVAVLNRRTQVEVDDLCKEMASAIATPKGFLHSCPAWRDRLRARSATRWGVGLAAMLLIALLLTPRREQLEPTTDYMNVVLVPEQSSLPLDQSLAVQSRAGVRSLDSVERKSIAMSEDLPTAPTAELEAGPVPLTAQSTVQPTIRELQMAPPAAAATLTDRLVADAGSLGAPAPALGEAEGLMRIDVAHDAKKLETGAAAQRLDRDEKGPEGVSQELAALQPQMVNREPQAIAQLVPLTAPPGVEPGSGMAGRVVEDVGTYTGQQPLTANPGTRMEISRTKQELSRGAVGPRLARDDSVAEAEIGSGGGSIQSFQPQVTGKGPQTVAMAVGPTAKPGGVPDGRLVQDAGTLAGGQPVAMNAGPKATVGRGTQRLARGASTGRQTHVEVAAVGLPGGEGSMRTYQPRLEGKGANAVITAATTRVGLAAAPTGKLETNRDEVVGGMQMKASPLEFTEYRGHRIPVARMGEQLTALTIADGNQGHILDGSVSTSEVAMSWKSGRFRVHGPGQPPAAEPPTQCYVGKNKVGGRDYLYIGFICTDPNLDQLVLTHPGGLGVERDDSIEIFLDTQNSRQSYNHILISARGAYAAFHCPSAEKGINGLGTPWDPGAQIKTAINREAKQWTCEVLIPFDRLGGVPAKGSRWPVNFSRNFRGQAHPQQVLSSWFLVYEGNSVNYHHPRLFGLFEW